MILDGRLLLRLPAADLAKLRSVVPRGERSAWIRAVLLRAVEAREAELVIAADMQQMTAERDRQAALAEERRQQRIRNMRQNAK